MRMKLDFWTNNEEGDEVYTLGYFGWVWQEGDLLRAGPGPLFGNQDPEGRVVATLVKGLWRTDITKPATYTDFDVQLAEPPLRKLEKAVEWEHEDDSYSWKVNESTSEPHNLILWVFDTHECVEWWCSPPHPDFKHKVYAHGHVWGTGGGCVEGANVEKAKALAESALADWYAGVPCALPEDER